MSKRNVVDVLQRFVVEFGDDVKQSTFNVDRSNHPETEALDDELFASKNVEAVLLEARADSRRKIAQRYKTRIENLQLQTKLFSLTDCKRGLKFHSAGHGQNE